MRDDLDYDERKRKGSKDAIVASAIKQLFAPLVLADTLKNAAVSKDKKIKDAFKESTENYPESVFEKNYESIDAIESHAPEFVAENPNIAAALGVTADILDPVSYLTLKGMGKAAPVLARGTMGVGDNIANSGTKKWVQKLTKKKGMADVPKITEYIKKNDLRGKLTQPEKVLETLRGKEELVLEGPKGLEVASSKKISEGTLDKTGQRIKQTLRMADHNGAPKVNRGEIFESLVRSKKTQNADDTVAKTVDVEAYGDRLKSILKPYETKRAIFPAKEVKKPDTMPLLEDDLSGAMSKLQAEAEKSKILKLNVDEQAKVRKAAESQAKKDADALAKTKEKAVQSDKEAAEKLRNSPKIEAEKELAERQKTIAAQKAEREKAEKLTSKENEKIAKTNQSVEEQILSLLAQKKMKTSRPKPMDELPIPKTQKGLPPIPAKEILDIKKHNKKAKAVNQQYLDMDEIPAPKKIEEMIAELQGKKLAPKEVDVPPPMTEEMFPPVNDRVLPEVPPKIETSEILAKQAPDVDVPPPMPLEGVRPVEEILAEIQDLKNSRANLGKTNAKIAKENQSKMSQYQTEKKLAQPQVMEVTTPRMSELERLWELKFSLRKQLRDADYDKSITDLTDHKQMLMNTLHKVEDAIQKSADTVNLPQGRAGDVYRFDNDDYSTQKMFEELLVDETLANWKSGGKRKGGAIPAITAAGGAALAAKTAGGSIPLSALAGGVAGETARRGFFASIPELQAKFGDKLSKPLPAHLATQATIEAAEIPFEYQREGVEREGFDAPNQDENFDPMKVNIKKSSPELQRLLNKQGRNPGSVVEIPGADEATDIMGPEGSVEQKMEETLNPQRPLFDPYINDELLNTPLPRDSKRLLQNKEVLRAKVQQLAPDKLPLLEDMMTNDPESMAENGGKIAMMFPAIFEKDKYGMFDGKIVDPMMQEKFLLDLSEDESMSSIEKAGVAMKVRRGQSIYGE